MIATLKTGTKVFVDASWIEWFLFPRLTDEQVSRVIHDYFLHSVRTHPGGYYSDPPTVRHTHNKTLITHFRGLDI